MDSPDLESLFDRYRREHDLAAIGRVFDVTAPELLLLARHLAPRGHDARDLLQETFLAAIESAVSFDPSRPLRAWLFGILLNRARRRRRVGRDGTVSFDSNALASVAIDADPATSIARSELVARVSAAFDSLGGAQRDAALRVLLQGANANEYARDSGRSHGAVRKLVERARVALRRALGPTFVGLGWAALTDRIACAATRRAVMRAVAREGVWMSSGVAALVGGVALVVATGFLTWWVEDPHRGRSIRGVDEARATANSALQRSESDHGDPANSGDPLPSSTTTDLTRESNAPEPAEPSPPPLPNVKGRLVIDGQPAAGRRIKVSARNVEASEPDEPAPATPYQRRTIVVTDGAGRFEGFVFTRGEVTIEVQPRQPESSTKIRGAEYSVEFETPPREAELAYETRRVRVHVAESTHGVLPHDLTIGVQLAWMWDYHPELIHADRNPFQADLSASPVPSGQFEFVVAKHDAYIAYAQANCHRRVDSITAEIDSKATSCEIPLSIRSLGDGKPTKLRVRWPTESRDQGVSGDPALAAFASLSRSVRLVACRDGTEFTPHSPGFFHGGFDFPCLPSGEYELLADPPFPVREPTIVRVPATSPKELVIAPILDVTPLSRCEGRIDVAVLEELLGSSDDLPIQVTLAPTTFPANRFTTNVDRTTGKFAFEVFPTGATILEVRSFDPFRLSPPAIELHFDAPPRTIVPIVVHRDRVEVIP